MQQSKTRHIDDGTAVDQSGLNFCPYQIFGFIDCSIDRINRPYSGPDGDYVGARKPFQDAFQCAVYTAYKKLHGIKVEVVLLPNDIVTLFGPVSARRHDVGGVLLTSGWEIQQGKEHIYCAFGDGAYNANCKCKFDQWRISMFTFYILKINFATSYSFLMIGTRSYFRPLVAGQDLTPAQKLCNTVIAACLQTIKHSFGDVENIFQICVVPQSLRLGKKVPHAQEQLRVCHLLSNIYSCLNGNKASSYSKFNCPPPLLADYLRLD